MSLSLAVVFKLDVSPGPSGLMPVSLEPSFVELVLLWAPVFVEVVGVVEIAEIVEVALFVVGGEVLVARIHCAVEFTVTSPCVHQVD